MNEKSKANYWKSEDLIIKQEYMPTWHLHQFPKRVCLEETTDSRAGSTKKSVDTKGAVDEHKVNQASHYFETALLPANYIRISICSIQKH